MKTIFLLMAQYNGKAIIPVEDVCRDYFSHLTPQKFLRKVDGGDLPIAVVRIEGSQKAAKGVYIEHLAAYIDEQAAKAHKEYRQIYRR